MATDRAIMRRMERELPRALSRLAEFRRHWWIGGAARLRRQSALLGAAWADGYYLNAWPAAALFLPALALLAGIVFGAAHPKIQILQPPQAVFAQSRPVLFAAAILGALGAQLGLLLTLGYGAGEFLFTASPFARPHLSVLYILGRLDAPRLASYALLFLLAVQPALVARPLAAGAAPLLRRCGRWRDAAGWLLAALAQGALVWGWVHAAPSVMRLPWLWTTGMPQITFFDFWAFARYLPVAAALALLARGGLASLARRRGIDGTTELLAALAAADAAPGWPRRLPPPAGQTGAALLTALFLLGLVASWRRAVMMIAIVIVLYLTRLYLLPRLTPWTALMRRTPLLLRWLAGIAFTLAVAKGWMALPWSDVNRNASWGSFGAELCGIGLGLAATLALFPLPPRGPELPEKPAHWKRGILPLSLAVYILSTRAGYAFCLDPSCCFGNNFQAAMAIVGMGMLLAGLAMLAAPEIAGLAALNTLLGLEAENIEAASLETKNLEAIAKEIEEYLGGEGKVLRNADQDPVLMKSGKKIRFDINNSGDDEPHFHLEKQSSSGRWKDAGPSHRYYFKR